MSLRDRIESVRHEIEAVSLYAIEGRFELAVNLSEKLRGKLDRLERRYRQRVARQRGKLVA